jgi:hypothetical protein
LEESFGKRFVNNFPISLSKKDMQILKEILNFIEQHEKKFDLKSLPHMFQLEQLKNVEKLENALIEAQSIVPSEIHQQMKNDGQEDSYVTCSIS